jgi:hypothetical protein
MQISLMALWHMLFEGGKSPLLITSFVACQSSVLEEDLQRCGSDPDIHLLSDQLIGDRVIMVINLDMVVDIDPGFFPFGVFIGMSRQGF